MPTKFIPMNTQPDNSFFVNAVEGYIRGRTTIENPTIRDYVMHYGSTGKVADKLVAEGEYTNRKSALRQVERMLKNPNLKISKRTQQHLGALQFKPGRARVTIDGYYSYDFTKWRYGKFSYTLSPEDMGKVVSSVRSSFNTEEANQSALNSFMDSYGVGTYFSFARGVKASIIPVS